MLSFTLSCGGCSKLASKSSHYPATHQQCSLFLRETISRLYNAFSKCVGSIQVSRASSVVKGGASNGQFGQLYWQAKKKIRSILLDTGRNDSHSKPNLGKEPESSLMEWGLNKQESTSSMRSQATISIYKSIVFLYASNEKPQNKIKKTVPFTLVPKELIT